MSAETYVPAREVARQLGIKVGTLGKWRYLQKGPKGWIRLSETLVVYPLAELEAWKAERAASHPSHGFGISPIRRNDTLTV